jgi:hypothetical protein
VYCRDNGEEHVFDGQTFKVMLKAMNVLRRLRDATLAFLAARLAGWRDIVIGMRDFDELFWKMGQAQFGRSSLRKATRIFSKIGHKRFSFD